MKSCPHWLFLAAAAQAPHMLLFALSCAATGCHAQSLGGNSKTCLCATIGPAQFNFEETHSTLNFATRAMSACVVWGLRSVWEKASCWRNGSAALS